MPEKSASDEGTEAFYTKLHDQEEVLDQQYEGQIGDRLTEDDYTTKNLMDVCIGSGINNILYQYDQKFSDRVRIYVQGGNGGSGCAAFSRENYGSSMINLIY